MAEPIDLHAGRIKAVARQMWPVLQADGRAIFTIDSADVRIWIEAARCLRDHHGVNINTMLCGTDPCMIAAYLDDQAPYPHPHEARTLGTPENRAQRAPR